MRYININKQIHRMHNEYAMDKITAEIAKPGAFDAFDMVKISSCISSKLKEKLNALICIANVELLSTSKDTMMSWYSHLINFESAGFLLDIRRVIGTDSDVDLYFIPNGSSRAGMALLLEKYSGMELILEVRNNERLILEALIYVDKSAVAAEGNGRLVQINQNDMSGNISINIRIA